MTPDQEECSTYPRRAALASRLNVSSAARWLAEIMMWRPMQDASHRWPWGRATAAMGGRCAHLSRRPSLWLTAPLDLAFAPVPLPTGEEVLSPVRAVYETGQGRFRMRPACLSAQRLPTYRAGEPLVFRAVLKLPCSLAPALGGYQFAVVGVSEQSGVKFYPPQTFGTIDPAAASAAAHASVASQGFDLSVVVPIRAPAERSKRIMLVRRLYPFDTTALHRELTAAMAPPAARINAVVSRLAGYAPGYLEACQCPCGPVLLCRAWPAGGRANYTSTCART